MCWLDLGWQDFRFMWRGPLRNDYSRVFERLDKALSNPKWRRRSYEAIVKVLPRTSFDDHPILILLMGDRDY